MHLVKQNRSLSVDLTVNFLPFTVIQMKPNEVFRSKSVAELDLLLNF